MHFMVRANLFVMCRWDVYELEESFRQTMAMVISTGCPKKVSHIFTAAVEESYCTVRFYAMSFVFILNFYRTHVDNRTFMLKCKSCIKIRCIIDYINVTANAWF